MPAAIPSSATRVGAWDSDGGASSPAIQSRLVGTSATSKGPPGTPGNRYMVPVDKVKRSPPEVVAMQRKLAEYEAMEEDDLDVGQVMELTQLEEELRHQEMQQDAEIATFSKSTPAKGSTPAHKPSPNTARALAALRWDDGAAASKGSRSEIRKTPMPKPKPGQTVGSGRKSTLGTPASASSSRKSQVPSEDEEDVVEDDDFADDDDLGPSANEDVEEALAIVPRSARKAASTGRSFSTTALIMLFVSYALWWREEKIAVGFCDTNGETNTLVKTRQSNYSPSLALSSIPALPPKLLHTLDVAHVRPTCTSCPAHGVCSDGAFVGCKPDYVPQANVLSLGGLLPVSPRCEPDTEKLMAVAVQASRAARLLKRRKGEVICAGLEKSRRKRKADDVWVYGVSADDIMESLKTENEVRSPL